MPKSTINDVLLLAISLLWVFVVLECQETRDKLRDQISQVDVKPEKHINTEKCGDDYESSSGTLDYYFENGTYPVLASCSWSITVAMGSVIIITFTKFETEREYDYLYIGETGNILLEASGGTKPDEVISSTNKVKVKFTSDWIFSYSGFTLNWKTKDSSSSSFSHLMAQCPPVLPIVTCPPPPEPVTCPPPRHCPPPSSICPICPDSKTCPPPPPTPTCPPPAACSERMGVLALDNRSQRVLGFHEANTNILVEHCLDPWVFLKLTGECLLNSPEAHTADGAEVACKNLGARLILPQDTAILGAFMNTSQWIGDYYVGANDRGSPGHYRWHNGTSIPDSAFWKDFPKEGEPGNSCVVINYFYGTEKLIASRETNCDKDKWRYICQK